jgi:ABC-2 type transport system permease protein
MLREYRGSPWVLARFTVRRTARGAVLWGLAMALYSYASVVGFENLGPTPESRRPFVDALSGNVGLQALMGIPHRVDTVGGFVTWRATGVLSLVGAIWGLMLATRVTRGEEAAGRWELFLAGRTTRRRAVADVLVGLGCAVSVLWLLALAGIAAAGARPGAGFTLEGEVLFATAVVAGAAQFLAIGALAGQLMPVRPQAVGLAAGVLGVTFMLRAVGDVAPAAHWLVYASPFGWIGQVRSLSDPHPLWLLPPAGLVAVLVLATVWLAGRRDLGASTLPDRDVAVAHTRLLGSHRLLAVRLTRTSVLSWLAVAAFSGLAYGSFARSAGDAFATSEVATRLTRDLAHESRQSQGARLYAGIIFLFAMLLLMGYVASALTVLREEEADGHLDNLLARPIRRVDWLVIRISLVAVVAVLGGACAGLGFWAAASGTGLTFGELLRAGLNAAAPAVLLLGIGLLTLGVVPRWTAVVGYTLVAWSFLVDMIGSVLHLNQWLLDTSLLQHLALAPVVAVDWTVVLVYIVLAVLVGGVGILAFARRDLQPH